MTRRAFALPRRSGWLLSAMLALAACGNTEGQQPFATFAQAVGQRALGSVGLGQGTGDDASVPTAATLPPELREQFPGPLLLLEVPSLGNSAIYAPTGRNGDNVTWAGAQERSVILTERGLFRGSRGFGFDVLSSNVTPTEHALARGASGPTQRLQRTVDGRVQETSEVHDCTLTRDGREEVVILQSAVSLSRFTESCVAGDLRFDNVYWLNDAGLIVRSRQWGGRQLGHFQLTRLD